MPTSYFKQIPLIIELALKLNPVSILDIGIGFGKWGFLFREYLDINSFLFKESPAYDPEGYRNKNYIYKDKENWKRTIDGIEVAAEYVGTIQNLIYNKIFIGNIEEIADSLNTYDLIICGDIIEHIEKEKGKGLVKKLYQKSNDAIIIATPAYFIPQGSIFDNIHESHKSFWIESDFKEYKFTQFYYRSGMLIAVLLKHRRERLIKGEGIMTGFAYKLYGMIENRAIMRFGVEHYENSFLVKIIKRGKKIFEKIPFQA